MRTRTHRALARFSTGATPIIKKTTWPSCVAECWSSWWRRCRRWRWTRPSWAASGLTIQYLIFLDKILSTSQLPQGHRPFQPWCQGAQRDFEVQAACICFAFLSSPIIISPAQSILAVSVLCIFTSLMPGWSSLESECTPASRSTPGEQTSFSPFLTSYENMQKGPRSIPGEHHFHLFSLAMQNIQKRTEEYTRWTFFVKHTTTIFCHQLVKYESRIFKMCSSFQGRQTKTRWADSQNSFSACQVGTGWFLIGLELFISRFDIRNQISKYFFPGSIFLIRV